MKTEIIIRKSRYLSTLRLPGLSRDFARDGLRGKVSLPNQRLEPAQNGPEAGISSLSSRTGGLGAVEQVNEDRIVLSCRTKLPLKTNPSAL
jgi:hypothetical protein